MQLLYRYQDKKLPNILDEIVNNKKLEVAELKKKTSLDQLKEKVSVLGKCRNFYKAVTKENPRGLNVIAEVKKASPSAGVIREDFDPAEIAQTYLDCGADAISVLTDEKYFQGKLEYIKLVKDTVDLPVIRKDFIVDLWQVYQSRLAGADAILLIAEVLDTAQISDLMIAASQLSLTVLLEVHSAESMLAVRSMIGFPQAGYSVLGINNRDLTTMTIDINNTTRLSEFAEDKKQLISESGIRHRSDVEKLIKTGVGAVLIGQTLCQSSSIEDKFRELFG